MAVFLDTQSISSEISQLIKGAQKSIVLISPYIQVSQTFKDKLATISDNKKVKDFTLICRKDELKNSEFEWMKTIKNLTILEKENLHAKCYLNEQKAVICSMNLYKFSQENNVEMGILITKKDDPEAFKSLLQEVDIIKKSSNTKFKATGPEPSYETLTPIQKLNYKLINELVEYRKENNEKKNKNHQILTSTELIGLSCLKTPSTESLTELLSAEKLDEYHNQIMSKLSYAKKFTIGSIKKVVERTGTEIYPKVVFKVLNGKEMTLNCTESNRPKTSNLVAVRINESWFNERIYLD